MATRVTAGLARRWLKPRPRNAHKGTSGRVLIIAGSKGMAGAAVLCAQGAVRSGAGLVRLLIVKSQQPFAAKRAPLEVMTQPLPETKNGALALGALPAVMKTILKWRPEVIAVGPGLTTGPGVSRLVRSLLSKKGLRVILDADGLNTLAAWRHPRIKADMILTPHEGELARLLKTTATAVKRERIASAKKAALKFRSICLLKGPRTLVTDGRRVFENTTGNPAMASGGMGDTLTGIVAAQWAQDLGHAAESAALAAFVHGFAADLAVKQFPERTLLATDVAAALPRAFGKIWRKK